MLDEYIRGDVERISPEAPVPVVRVGRENTTLGGAGNVIRNMVALGGDVAAIGIVGDDMQGWQLIEYLGDFRVDTTGVLRVDDRSTTRKVRINCGHQQMLRVDYESNAPVSGNDVQRMLKQVERKIQEVDTVVISDYAKGVVTEDVMSTISTFCKLYDKRLIVDPKGSDFKKYSGATILTPNVDELSLATGFGIADKEDLRFAALRLLEDVAVDSLLVTRGADGMAYFERDKEPLFVGSEAQQVFDVSGAGDTVVAVLSVALSEGRSMQDAIRLANIAAGIAVSKVGTATVTWGEIEG